MIEQEEYDYEGSLVNLPTVFRTLDFESFHATNLGEVVKLETLRGETHPRIQKCVRIGAEMMHTSMALTN